MKKSRSKVQKIFLSMDGQNLFRVNYDPMLDCIVSEKVEIGDPKNLNGRLVDILGQKIDRSIGNERTKVRINFKGSFSNETKKYVEQGLNSSYEGIDVKLKYLWSS